MFLLSPWLLTLTTLSFPITRWSRGGPGSWYASLCSGESGDGFSDSYKWKLQTINRLAPHAHTHISLLPHTPHFFHTYTYTPTHSLCHVLDGYIDRFRAVDALTWIEGGLPEHWSHFNHRCQAKVVKRVDEDKWICCVYWAVEIVQCLIRVLCVRGDVCGRVYVWLVGDNKKAVAINGIFSLLSFFQINTYLSFLSSQLNPMIIICLWNTYITYYISHAKLAGTGYNNYLSSGLI